MNAVEAVRAVRLAAHDLINACGAVCGGIPMAIGVSTLPSLTEDPHEIEPEGFEDEGGSVQ